MSPPAATRMARHDAPPLDRAAIILATLDDDRAKRIFAKLDEEEIRRVSRAMARLGRTGNSLVKHTVDQFRDEIVGTGKVQGTVESTERLLLRFMPAEKVSDIIGDIKGMPDSAGHIWEKLANVAPQTLAGYLGNEFPQTVAVVLARLPAAQAARVLQLLPESISGEVALRIVRLDTIQGVVLSGIEQTLEREFSDALTQSDGPDSALALAEVLNNSDKSTVERVMAALEEREPAIARRVRKRMFGFEDLQRIDPSCFGLMIAECPVDRMAIALSAAPAELRDMFLSRMSERAGKMLREEIETLPPQRKRAVDEAQAELVAVAKRLMEDGRVFLTAEEGEGGDDE